MSSELLKEDIQADISVSLAAHFSSFFLHKTAHPRPPISQNKTNNIIQSSILGPCFLMYVNDKFTSVRHDTPFFFVEDVKILYTFNFQTCFFS